MNENKLYMKIFVYEKCVPQQHNIFSFIPEAHKFILGENSYYCPLQGATYLMVLILSVLLDLQNVI